MALQINAEVPDVLSVWYADDNAMAGFATCIGTRILKMNGPLQGYFLEQEKSITICRPEDREEAERVLAEFNFTFKDGFRYVGGLIGTDEARQKWLAPIIDKWIEDVCFLL